MTPEAEIWSTDQIWSIIGVLLASAYILVQGMAVLRRQRPRRISYDFNTAILYSGAHGISGLTAHLQGQNVDRLAASIVELKNDGKESLTDTIIPTLDRLRIVLPDQVSLLDHPELVEQSLESCGFRCARNPSSETVLVEFDYMDPGDRCAVRILHSGDDQTQVRLQGRVIGGDVVRRKRKRSRGRLLWGFYAILGSLVLAVPVTMRVISLLDNSGIDHPSIVAISASGATLISVTIGLTIFRLGWMIISRLKRRRR